MESILCISFFFHLTDARWGSSLKLNYWLCNVAFNSYLIIYAYLDKQTIVKWKGKWTKAKMRYTRAAEWFFFFFFPHVLFFSHLPHKVTLTFVTEITKGQRGRTVDYVWLGHKVFRFHEVSYFSTCHWMSSRLPCHQMNLIKAEGSALWQRAWALAVHS